MTVKLYDETLSYVHGASDVPLIGSTIGDLFDCVAVKEPDQESLVSCQHGLRYSYSELRDAYTQFTRALLTLGVRKSDRIGTEAPNHAEWIVAQYGTPKIGAILVNTNPAYRTH